jgi:hypothetical protein
MAICVAYALWRGCREAAHSVAESCRDRRARWQTRAASRRGWTTRDLMAPTVSARAVRFGITTGAVLGTASVAAWLAGKGFGRGARAGWHLGRTWGNARLKRRRYGVEPGQPEDATEVIDAELVEDDDQADEQPPTPREPVAELADRPADPPTEDVPDNRPGYPMNGEPMEEIQSDVVTYDVHVKNLTTLQAEAHSEYEAAELAHEAAAAAKRRAMSDLTHVEAIVAGLISVDFGQKHSGNANRLMALISEQVAAADALKKAAARLMDGAAQIEAEAENARHEFEADHRALAEAHADAPHAAKREGYVPQ